MDPSRAPDDCTFEETKLGSLRAIVMKGFLPSLAGNLAGSSQLDGISFVESAMITIFGPGNLASPKTSY